MLRTLAMSLALGCMLGPGSWSAPPSREGASAIAEASADRLSLGAGWSASLAEPRRSSRGERGREGLSRAQGGYSYGVFVGTEHGPIELTAYAEVGTSGQLRMAKGARQNVPTLSDIQRLLCNLPNWQPGAVMIANEDIFMNEKAERRELRFAVRRLNISALELKVEDLERSERLAELMQGVGASEKSPAYVFVVMVGNGMSRFYPFRVRLE